jgi:hypothetical protein
MVIDAKLKLWAQITCVDLAFALTDSLREALQERLARVSQQRANITQPINPADPNYVRLTADQQAGLGFLTQRLSRIGQFQLEDHPDFS